MKVNFSVYCLGYNVGGRNFPFGIEIEDDKLKDMKHSEKEEFIFNICWDYLLENLELCIDDIEEDESSDKVNLFY